MQRVVFFLLFLFIFFNAEGSDKRKKAKPGKEVEIVFCVDLSGSTNGLINDLRDNLWHIINQSSFIAPDAQFKIGVVAFSRPTFKKENSYVKILCDLTTDYDFLASELSRIRPYIEKGDQYVGAAIEKCVSGISWSNDARKFIYIIGNGMVESTGSDFQSACEHALRKDITINSIYVVGKNKAKEFMGWLRIAKNGNGLSSEMTVGAREDWSSYTVNYQALFNAMRDYNFTVCYYTISGYEYYMNYRQTDSLAFTGGNSTLYERAYYKLKNFTPGRNASWDMVDYHIKTGLMPANNDSSLLPDSLKDKSGEYIYDLIKTLKSDRQRAVASIKNVLASDVPSRNHENYKNETWKEDRNIFSRCVINMMMKQIQY